MTVDNIKKTTQKKRGENGNNGNETYRNILDYTISNTSNEHRLGLHRFTKRVIAATGYDNAWQLKSKFFLTVSYNVNIIGFIKKSIDDKIQ